MGAQKFSLLKDWWKKRELTHNKALDKRIGTNGGRVQKTNQTKEFKNEGIVRQPPRLKAEYST